MISTTFLTSAILSLRQKLGTTQEEMARQIGCTLAAYQRWETGKRTPRGDWMLKILVLCPDEETRAAFFVDISQASSKMAASPRPEVPIVEKEAPHPGGARASGKLASRYYKSNPNRR